MHVLVDAFFHRPGEIHDVSCFACATAAWRLAFFYPYSVRFSLSYIDVECRSIRSHTLCYLNITLNAFSHKIVYYRCPFFHSVFSVSFATNFFPLLLRVHVLVDTYHHTTVCVCVSAHG